MDPVAQARAAHLAIVAGMFDHLVQCGGRSDNERTLVALMLLDEWRVAHHEHGLRRFELIQRLGFAGDAFPAPILRDYSRGIDVVFRFPLRCGDRLIRTPFAFFSDHGARFAASVDDDCSPEAAERDRVFSTAGWGVLRFSKAEMQRDASRVFCEIQARVTAADWIAEEPSDPARKGEAEESFHAEMHNYDSSRSRST